MTEGNKKGVTVHSFSSMLIFGHTMWRHEIKCLGSLVTQITVVHVTYLDFIFYPSLSSSQLFSLPPPFSLFLSLSVASGLLTNPNMVHL